MISGKTTLIAHLGYPTETFKAPMIYNPYFESAGINAVVVPMACQAHAFARVLPALFALDNMRGALITMPHKVSVMALLDEVTPAAQVAGAKLAVDYFVYRVTKEIGALAAVLGGIDGIVFTAGIGENSPAIRARICEASAWLGIDLDAEANRRRQSRISRPGSRVSAWVIPTNEELMIARHTAVLLGLAEARV